MVPFRRFLLCLAFLLVSPCTVLLAQRNAFFFPAPPQLPDVSPFVFLYRIPADSVERIVFHNGAVDPRTPWMQREAYRVAAGREDSLLRSPIAPGYYLAVRALRNAVSAQIRRKEAFTARFLSLDEVQLLSIRGPDGRPDTTAFVQQGQTQLHYSSRMDAFVLDHLAQGDTIRIRKGADFDQYRTEVRPRGGYQSLRAENRAATEARQRREFNGYLVTNKPKYLPGDTVKWKAYLQLPDEEARLVTEPLTVSLALHSGYGYGYDDDYYSPRPSGKTYPVAKAQAAAEPGLYFGEFVLGDTVAIDNDYELRLQGTRSGLQLSNRFRLEDYLLEETTLRVTGEDLKFYQKGDSVLLYAAGTDANGLPVLDGTLRIVVLPSNYSLQPDSFFFLPDTLYQATLPVSPEGDTKLAFGTAGLPDELADMRVLVSMVNGNGERKDTSFVLQYSAATPYLRHTLAGRSLLVESIRGKRPVAASGFLVRTSGDRTDTSYLRYPHRLQLQSDDNYLQFYLQDSSGKIVAQDGLSAPRAELAGLTDFDRDTAYLRLQNPAGLLYRYGVYRGDQFLGYGAVRGDTTIAVHSPKGETVTVDGYYAVQNDLVPARFELFRLDRNLHIGLRKKDLVFPGQSDTLLVSLRNDRGEAVGNTNVTVLAFNAQFERDNVPELPYNGTVFPAYQHGRYERNVFQLRGRGSVETRPDRAWLSRCGADTMFFYRSLYLLPDKVAWLHFPIQDPEAAQVAFYLKKGDEYLRPELILVDSRPVYYAGASSTNPDALLLPPGIHQIQYRTRSDRFYLNNFQVCAGFKTVFFARVDSLGPYRWKEKTGDSSGRERFWQDTTLAKVIVHADAPDSLDAGERRLLLSFLFMYRSDYEAPAWLFQGQNAFRAGNEREVHPRYRLYNGFEYGSYSNRFSIVGPLNLRDSIGFFQAGNTKLRFLPEPQYLHSFRAGGERRLERQLLSDYLTGRLSGGTVWPAPDRVSEPELSYDSAVVNPPQRERNEEQGPVAGTPFALKSRRQWTFRYSPPAPDSTADARLWLTVRADNHQALRVLLRDRRGAAWLVREDSYRDLKLPAGLYTGQVFWSDDSLSELSPFLLRRGGITVLRVQRGRPTAFRYTSPPAGWLPFLRPAVEGTRLRGELTHQPGATGDSTGSIRGQLSSTVAHENRALRLLLRRVDRPGDRPLLFSGFDGSFEADGLAAGRYQLQIAYGEGGLLEGTVNVRQNSMAELSITEWVVLPEHPQPPIAFRASTSTGIDGMVFKRAGEPLVTWPVKLCANGREVATVYTNDDGHYLVKPLRPGRYRVRVLFNDEVTERAVTVGPKQLATVTVYCRPGDRLLQAGGISERNEQRSYSSASMAAESYLEVQLAPPYPGSGESGASRASLRNASQCEFQGNRMRNRGDVGINAYRANAYDAFSFGEELEEHDSLGAGLRPIDPSAAARRSSPADREALARQAFVGNFLRNMAAGSGLRRNFRDWAIWEPDLWTDQRGEARFRVRYPDNLTSWKTYVLAMNRDGYSGKIVELTRAYKPLAASLSAPRFLRYGDTAVVIGKVANYTGRPFALRAGFRQDGRALKSDSFTVNNSRVSVQQVVAPSSDSVETLALPLVYSIAAEGGFADGEERLLPVLPVGTVQSRGELFVLNGDTSVRSRPDSSQRFFTGKARLRVDGGVLDLMLREIQQLKEYPYGCMEQLTTKLLAIAYEEEVKRLLGDRNFNNAKTKRQILEQLIAAQRRDGGFAWFREGPVDYRITNYILSTLQRANGDHWLDVVLRRGYDHLTNHLEELSVGDQISALSTLSAAGRSDARFISLLGKLDTLKLGVYERLTLLRVRREQRLPYAGRLDTVLQSATEDHSGLYWTFDSYDWYRDDLAANLMALRLVRGDSVYGGLAEKITRHVLLQRQPDGSYRSTASSGLVLSTILPYLLRAGTDTARLRKGLPTAFVQVSGAVRDTFSRFPQTFEVRNPQPSFSLRKTGVAPVYASVVYEYYQPQPLPHDSNFSVRSLLLNSRGDTVASLKQGEKAVLRAVVRVRRRGDYVMINVPVPAGCVQTDRDKTGRQYFEDSRESFKDQTAIFCRELGPGLYTFDVPVEARYRGSYRVSPARAGLMYYPEEYGNAAVQQVRVE